MKKLLRQKKAILIVALLWAYTALWYRFSPILFPPKELFSDLESVHTISVKNRYSLRQEEGQWRSAEGLKVDPEQLQKIVTAFRTMKKLPLAAGQSGNVESLKPQFGELMVTTKKGIQTVVLGKLNAEGHTRYAWLLGEETGFGLDEGSLQHILKQNPLLMRPLLFQPAQLKTLVINRVGIDGSTVTLRRNNSRWFVNHGQQSIVADTEDSTRLLNNLTKLSATPLFFPTRRGNSPPEHALPNPLLTLELNFHSARSLRVFFFEIEKKTVGELTKTATLLRIEGESDLYEIEEHLPPELIGLTETLRDRTLFSQIEPRLNRRSLASVCVFRGKAPLFELLPAGDHWTIGTGCGYGVPQGERAGAVTPLVGALLRLRVASFLPSPTLEHNEQEEPLRFELTQNDVGNTAIPRRTFTVSFDRPKPGSNENAPAWEVTASVEKHLRAVVPPQTARALLEEVRLLETRLSSNRTTILPDNAALPSPP